MKKFSVSIIIVFLSIQGYSQTDNIVDLMIRSYTKFYAENSNYIEKPANLNKNCMEKPANFYDDFSDKFNFSRYTKDKTDISYSYSDVLSSPLKRQLIATSEFGIRNGTYHRGIDLALTEGVDTVCSVFCGTVRIASYDEHFGYYIIIKHYNGIETLYAHLKTILVKRGEDVKYGDPIGIGGNTGRSTGAHLHFEVQTNQNPRNPRLLLEKIGLKPLR